MKRIVLFSSPKASDHGLAGLEFLRELSKQQGGKEDIIVVMMQDAILLALNNIAQPSGEEHDTFAGVSKAYVLNEHLVRRGFDPRSLRLPFKLAGYDEIVELMMQDDVQVIGSF